MRPGGGRRPWRAVAYVRDATAPNGRRRTVAGRTAAKTPDGLSRFVLEHRQLGHAVQVFKVLSLDEAIVDGTMRLAATIVDHEVRYQTSETDFVAPPEAPRGRDYTGPALGMLSDAD